jgi:hypothetical protein
MVDAAREGTWAIDELDATPPRSPVVSDGLALMPRGRLRHEAAASAVLPWERVD